MDWSDISVAIFGLLLAGVVKGATGLGYASCALPFLVATVGLQQAMGLVLFPAIATNITVALSTGHFSEIIKKFKILYISMLPGIIVGLFLLMHIEKEFAVKTLGVVIIFYVAFALFRPSMRLPIKYESILQLPTGFANGVITGLTGAQVMPLFPYVMSLHLDPARTVQTINIAVLIATFILGAGMLVAGLASPDVLLASLAAVVPAAIGTAIGSFMRDKIPAQKFKVLMLGALLLIGATLTIR